MLDAFAAVLVQNDTQRSVEDELTAEFLKLGSAEEIQKVASLLDCVKSPCDPSDYSWLSQYEGTPLYEQATTLEEQSLDIESQRVQYDLQQAQQRQTRPDFYAQEDLIRLKKKMLDLDLAKLKNGDAGVPAAPALDAPAAAPPPPAPAPEAKTASVDKEAFLGTGVSGLLRGASRAGSSVAHAAPSGGAKLLGGFVHGGQAIPGVPEHLLRSTGHLGRDAVKAVAHAPAKKEELAAAGKAMHSGTLRGALGSAAEKIRGMFSGGGGSLVPKTAEYQPIDLAGRALAHAFYKEALAVTREGHEYDAKRARIKEQAHAQMAGLSQEHGGLGYWDEGGGLHMGNLLKAVRGFSAGQHDVMGARHNAYVASKHEAGHNAWNPWGGTMTPAPGERGGTKGLLISRIGDFRKPEEKQDKTAASLTQAGREEIKPKNFAIPKGNGPGGTGKYPIHDESHARAALSMVAKHGTPAEKAKVHAAVVKKYPALAARSSVPAVREKAEREKAASAAMRAAALKLGIEKTALMQYLNPITAVPSLVAKGAEMGGKALGGKVGGLINKAGATAGKVTNFGSNASGTIAKFL